MTRLRSATPLVLVAWLVLSCGLAAAFTQAPLLQVLGYESAAALAVAGSLAGIMLGCRAAMPRRSRETVTHNDAWRPSPACAAWRGWWQTLLVIAIPIATLWFRGLFYPTCDGWQATRWLATLTLPSVTLGAIWGGCIGYVCRGFLGQRWWQRALAQGVAVLIWATVVLLALWRVYAHPTSRSFSPWIGYFPGNLYDELIVAPAALAWARLEQTLWAVAALAACTWHARRRMALSCQLPVGPYILVGRLAVVATLGAAVLALQSGTLGYRITARDIERELGGRRETPHFIIYYAATPAIEAQIDTIATEHEFRLSQAQAAMGVASLTGKIHSYYFATPAQKAAWFGARYTEMARPWHREIFLAHAATPHPSLRHEIAHVVAAELGDPWFAVSARQWWGLPVLANPGMIEGSAVMADWPGSYASELTPHQATAVLQQLDWAPRAGQLMSLAFFGASSAQGYTAAGSLVMYIRERFGVAAWQALYRNGGDMQAALGVSLTQLETDWHAHLARVALPPGAVEAVRERFSRPSVFARRCPHDAARLTESLRGAYGGGEDNASDGLASDEASVRAHGHAMTTLHAICDLSPSPDALMALGDWSLQRDKATAMGYYYQIARNPQLDAAHRADAYWSLAILQLPGAGAHVLVEEARALHLPLVWRRRFTMLDAVLMAGPAVTAAMQPRLLSEIRAGARPLAALTLPPTPTAPWLAPYLQLRDAAIAGDDARVVALAQAVLAAVADPLYRGAIARWIVEAAWHLGDDGAFDGAIAVLQEPALSPMDRLYAQDWTARRAFYRAGR